MKSSTSPTLFLPLLLVACVAASQDGPPDAGIVQAPHFTGAPEQRAGHVPFPRARTMPGPSRELLASNDPIHLETRMREALASGLGDALRAVALAGGDPADAFRRLARERPRWRARYGWFLPQLLRTDGRAAREWEAREGMEDDGFYTPTEWAQDPAAISFETWPRARGKALRGCEVATLAFLGQETTAGEAIDALKRVERDLASYPEWRGLTRPYKSARLIDNTFELSPEGDVFTWRVRYALESFTSPEIEFTLRDRYEADGTLVTEFFSETQRFGLMMGRSAYLPVLDSEGELAALMIVSGMVSDQPVWLMRALMREKLGNLIERAALPTALLVTRDLEHLTRRDHREGDPAQRAEAESADGLLKGHDRLGGCVGRRVRHAQDMPGESRIALDQIRDLARIARALLAGAQTCAEVSGSSGSSSSPHVNGSESLARRFRAANESWRMGRDMLIVSTARGRSALEPSADSGAGVGPAPVQGVRRESREPCAQQPP